MNYRLPARTPTVASIIAITWLMVMTRAKTGKTFSMKNSFTPGRPDRQP